MRWKLWLAGTAAALLAALLALWISTPDVSHLRRENPADTAFMRLRAAEARAAGRPWAPRRVWRPLGQISPNLVHAVIVAEDASFYDHHGVDLGELRASLERNLKRGRLARGGSTITQQLAKNLYLSPSKNPIRKIRELFIAWKLEGALDKSRILELYLNSIEWGDGVFGAEAAARAYFGVSAARLTADQAATLAALIPNPRRFAAQVGGRRVQKKKALILRRMRRRFGPAEVRETPKPAPPELAAPDDEEDDADDGDQGPAVGNN